MSNWQAILLGLVQGLTEFIPVSSSGHLVLLHQALGLSSQDLIFDVALHIGTLVALVVYFHRDLWQLALGLLGRNKQRRLAWLLVIATIPGVIAGMLLETAAESQFRSARLVSINLIIVAFLMLLAERLARRRQHQRGLKQVTKGQALTMGMAQAVALVPGVSRSGSTITTGLFLGLDRLAATRFSFLLAVPITFGAIIKTLFNSDGLHQIAQAGGPFTIGIITALLSGLLAIHFLLKFLARHSLAVFAYYRIALGGLVLLILTLH